jgi:hypothetical protein
MAGNPNEITPASWAIINRMLKDLKKKDHEDNLYAVEHKDEQWQEWLGRNYPDVVPSQDAQEYMAENICAAIQQKYISKILEGD